MIKKSGILFFLLGLMIFILIINCKAKNVVQEETKFAVHTIKAVKGEINDYIELNGDVKAKIEVDIYPDAMGKLESFAVNIGQSVYKGQIIAYINPSKPGMDFALSPVKSTISGTVTSLPVKRGATVTLQTAVAKVGRINDLEIITHIAEKFISKIKLGLTAIIKSDSAPDKTYFASVSEMSPVVDPTTRMMEIKLRFTGKHDELRPGIFVEIKIITENKNNIVKIPTECIVNKFGVNYVFVINKTNNNETTVTQQEVKIGIDIDNKAEIVSGLKGDEEIVYRGQSLLENNTKVNILQTVEPLSLEDNF
ncbi:MAG: efflux RND transporter periplasmic adaptor subunit [Spirochaetes bacterium]|nr:efflux RND transporter periplasmic adaptor subunit [Spirochaetota bacterium]